MDKLGGFTQLWSTVRDKFAGLLGRFRRQDSSDNGSDLNDPENAPADAEQVKPLAKAGFVVKTIGLWIFRLRKVFMAIPVIWCALRLASYNLEKLPEEVGLNLQASGAYAQVIDRNMAVYGPLGLTAACLLLMFFSRRARYPWVISIFTLVVPLLILVTNLYPQ